MWIALAIVIGLVLIVAAARAFLFAWPIMEIKLESKHPDNRLMMEAERLEWELVIAEQLYPEPTTLNQLSYEAVAARERANTSTGVVSAPALVPQTAKQPRFSSAHIPNARRI